MATEQPLSDLRSSYDCRSRTISAISSRWTRVEFQLLATDTFHLLTSQIVHSEATHIRCPKCGEDYELSEITVVGSEVRVTLCERSVLTIFFDYVAKTYGDFPGGCPWMLAFALAVKVRQMLATRNQKKALDLDVGISCLYRA